MRWPWQKPEEPIGVAIEFRNGDVMTCEIFYVGKIGGFYTWEITERVEVHEIKRLIVESGMPDRTAIRVNGTL